VPKPSLTAETRRKSNFSNAVQKGAGGAIRPPRAFILREATMGEPKLITPGVIASELGAPLHRVTRILRTRSHIRPLARAGVLRLYEREAVAQVRHELNTIDARRHARQQVTHG